MNKGLNYHYLNLSQTLSKFIDVSYINTKMINRGQSRLSVGSDTIIFVLWTKLYLEYLDCSS